MKLNVLLVSFTILFTSLLFSQSRETRKGHLFLKAGTEYRITPFVYGAIEDVNSYFTNIDIQSSGFAFNYSFDYFATRDLSLGFTHGFHYTLLNKDLYHPEDFGVSQSKYRMFFDFHLYLDYHFKVFKKNELFLRVGVSLLNRNSNFSIKEAVFDSEGNHVVDIYSEYDYAYEPTNIGIGYKTNKLEFMIGVYTSNQSEYFIETERLTIPYLKLNFNILKF